MSEWIEVLDKNDIELDRSEINVWIEANEFGNRYLVIPVEFIAEILNQNSAAKDEALAALTERVGKLEAVKSKASIVIAGWKQFGFTSDYDLNVLKETLRAALQEAQ